MSYETGPEITDRPRERHLKSVPDPEFVTEKKKPYSRDELTARRARKNNRNKLKRLVGTGLASALIATTAVGEGDPVKGAKYVNQGMGGVPGEVMERANNKISDIVTFDTDQYRGNELTDAQRELMRQDRAMREAPDQTVEKTVVEIIQAESVPQQVPVHISSGN